MTDGLQAGVENLQTAFGGKAMTGRYYDLLHGKGQVTETAEEIKEKIGNRLAIIGES